MTTEERFDRIERSLAGAVEAQRTQAESLIQLTQNIARFIDTADARMKRIEDNLDGLIRAITSERQIKSLAPG
jgi:ABC-type transporter Mla subunit MlaD